MKWRKYGQSKDKIIWVSNDGSGNIFQITNKRRPRASSGYFNLNVLLRLKDLRRDDFAFVYGNKP